jgi:hypothetical protein
MWDGNVIANHNVLIDTADGRQGSPLLPTALTTASFSPANAGDLTLGNDTFANFLGFDARIPGAGGANYNVSSAGYFLIVAPNGSYSCFGYGSNDGASLKTLAYKDIKSSSGQGPNQVSNGTAFPAGSMIYQCNAAGTPIGYALAMGKSALYYAKGAVSNEQIFHYDDFANSGNEAHLSAVGIQSVYGMAAYQDTNGRIPGVQLVEAVRQIPGFSY